MWGGVHLLGQLGHLLEVDKRENVDFLLKKGKRERAEKMPS